MNKKKLLTTICLMVLTVMVVFTSSCVNTEGNVYVNFTFDYQYDDKVVLVDVHAGEPVYAPVATREGYVFDGWFLNPDYAETSEYNFSSIMDTDVVLYAKWLRLNNVEFDTNGTSEEIASKVLKIGEEFEVPNPGVRDNDEFVGWSDGSNVYQVGDIYTVSSEKDVKLTAAWNVMYDVTFKDVDGTVLKTAVVPEGAAAEEPVVVSPSVYMKFAGWGDATLENVQSDMTVTAQYEYAPTEEQYFTFVGYKSEIKYDSDDNPYTEYVVTDVVDDIEYYEVMKSATETMPSVVVLPKEYNGKPVTGIMSSTSSNAAFGNTAAASESMNIVVIPNTYTSIGDYAFYNNLGLKAVVYEPGSTVKTIGNYAFALQNTQNRSANNNWDNNRFDVVIPASVETIGNYAFNNNGKVASLTFEEGSSLVTIGNYAFALENNRTRIPTTITDIVIPASVTSIGNYGFAYQAFSSIAFEAESKLETIGNYGFAQSNNTKADAEIVEIVFPASLTSIGDNSFYYLLVGKVDFSATNVKAIAKNAFNYCIGLTEVLLPAGLETIGESSFYNSPDLTSIVIPASVTSIAKSAFGNCSVLSVVVFESTGDPETEVALTIGETAFQNNVIEELVIPARVTSIGKSAFVASSEMTNLTFEDGDMPLAIGQFAFAAHTASSSSSTFKTALYTTVVFPTRLVTLDNNAFMGNFMLATVTFPVGTQLTKIGQQAFMYTPNLKTLTLHEGLEEISTNAFANYGSSATSMSLKVSVKGQVINAYAVNLALTTITIPSTVKTIGNSAFSYMGKLATLNFAPTPEDQTEVELTIGSALITTGTSIVNTALKKIEIPARVTSIGASTFKGLTALNSVTFGENSKLKAITASLFEGCTALEEIQIPASVTEIGNYAFRGCDSLVNIEFEEDAQVAKFGNECFAGTVLNELNIPASVTTLGTTIVLDTLTLENITVSEDNATFKSIDGVVYNKAGTQLVLFPASKLNQLVSYTVSDTVESIGQYVFAGAEELKEVDLNNVSTVELRAFANCSKLTTVNASSVTTWTNVSNYNRAFEGCISLSDITLNDTLTVLGGGMFAQCSSLEEITLPDTLTTISAGLFNESGLKSITFPAACTKIEASAFRACHFTELVIPATVTDILSSAFLYCRELKTLVIEGDILSSAAVGTTFHDMDSLEYLIIKGDYDTNGKAGANIVNGYNSEIFKGVYVNDAYYDAIIDRNSTAAANYRPFNNIITAGLLKKLSTRPADSILADEAKFQVSVNTNLPQEEVEAGAAVTADYFFVTGYAGLTVEALSSWTAEVSEAYKAQNNLVGLYTDPEMTIEWTGVSDCQFRDIVLYAKWEVASSEI